MTPRQFYKMHSRKEVEEMCAKADCAHETFRKIAYGQVCSFRLAKRLQKASNQMMTVYEILEPERFK